MTVRIWPSSDYDATCDACNAAISRTESRVRESEIAPGQRRKRTWHPTCYTVDPEGEAKLGRPSGSGGAGARVPRVSPPSGGPSQMVVTSSVAGSAPIAASPASHSDTRSYESLTSVSVEGEATDVEGGTRWLVRIQSRVPGEEVTAEIDAARMLIERRLAAWLERDEPDPSPSSEREDGA